MGLKDEENLNYSLPAIRVDFQLEYRHLGSHSVRMQLRVAWELWPSFDRGNGHRRMTVTTAVRPLQSGREIMANHLPRFGREFGQIYYIDLERGDGLPILRRLSAALLREFESITLLSSP